MLSISDFSFLNYDGSILVTRHAAHRLSERGIFMADIENCFKSGEIIEQYENDKPLASCLILGFTTQGRPLHVVASCDGEYIYLISAYYPNEEFWNSDYKTRRK